MNGRTTTRPWTGLYTWAGLATVDDFRALLGIIAGELQVRGLEHPAGLAYQAVSWLARPGVPPGPRLTGHRVYLVVVDTTPE